MSKSVSTSLSNDAPSGVYQRRREAVDKFLGFILHYGAFIAMVAVILFFSIRSPIFLTSFNLLNVLKQVAVLAVASFGMAAVVIGGGTDVIAGGIDLSIGANIGLTAAMMAIVLTSGQPIWLALLAGLLIALLVDFVNALAVVYLGLLPLLATLAMMYTVNGIELLLTKNMIISTDSSLVHFISGSVFLGIPMSVVILIVMLLLYSFILHLSRTGIHLQAVGGNPDAARTSGLRVRLLTILSYLLAGFAVFVSATLVLSRLSGSTPGIGSLILLDIVLATYVSATFSRRWVVNIPGVLLGAFFVGLLSNGFTLINVPTYWVHGIKGLLVLFVVSATALQQKRSGL